jgi:hypothetical protein
VLALASAVVMVANAPAMSGAPAGDQVERAAAPRTDASTLGRLVLTFEPAVPQIDRD